MMKRKLLSIIFCLVIPSFIMGSRPHKEMGQDPLSPQSPNRSIIVNDNTGELYVLPVVTNWVKDLGGGKFEAQYYVEIPRAVFLGKSHTPSPSSGKLSSILSYGRRDSTKSVVIYITKSTGCWYANNQQYEKTYKVLGAWERLDPAVRCTLLQPMALCNGPYYSGGWCGGFDSKLVYNPTPLVFYSKTPYWSTKWVLIAEAEYYQAGRTKAYLKRGSTTWTFSVQISNLCN